MNCTDCGEQMKQQTSLNRGIDWFDLDPIPDLLLVTYTCKKCRLRIDMQLPVMVSRMKEDESE